MNLSFGSVAVDAASRLLTPFMLMFGAYVVVHGEDSPGGGFQGGVIFAAALILIRLVRGRDVRWGLSSAWALRLACGGVGLFAGVGWACVLFGGRFLDYGALPLPLGPAANRAVGSFTIEIGVAAAVTGVLVLIFDALVGQPGDEA